MSKIVFILLIIHIKFSLTNVQIIPECNFEAQKFSTEKEPLYLIAHHQQYSMANVSKKFSSYYINYNEDQFLILACPTKKLRSGKLYEELIRLNCSQNGSKIIKTQSKYQHIVQVDDAEKFTCENSAYLSIRETGKCSSGMGEGIFYEIGAYVWFQNQGLLKEIKKFMSAIISDNQVYHWFGIYSVCYNIDLMNVGYTVHRVNYQILLEDYIEDDDPFILDDMDEYRIHYKFGNHKVYFDPFHVIDVLRNDIKVSDVEKYSNEKMFVRAVPMVPKRDIQVTSWRHAAEFSMNIAPLWSGTQGTRMNIEDQVKNNATKIQKNLVVYDGIYGIMVIENKYNESLPFFLNYKQYQIWVPQQSWKIVYEKTSQDGIMILTINDPFVGEEEAKDIMLCRESICEKYNWTGNNEFKRGYTYCCEINEVLKRKYFPNLPKLKVSGILEGPK